MRKGGKDESESKMANSKIIFFGLFILTRNYGQHEEELELMIRNLIKNKREII